MAGKSRYLQIRITPRQKAALKRLAALAGQDVSSYVLTRVLPEGQRRFEELIALLGDEDERRYALAGLNDLLAGLGREELGEVVRHADLGRFEPWVANYVAAMVEQACHMKGVTPPTWAGAVEPLEHPWFAAPLSSLRLHLLQAAPVAFKRRNLFVDATVGARV